MKPSNLKEKSLLAHQSQGVRPTNKLCAHVYLFIIMFTEKVTLISDDFQESFHEGIEPDPRMHYRYAIYPLR